MIFKSPHPDVEIPDVAFTPFMLERAAKHGDKPALIDGPTGRTLTFSQWAGATRKAAVGLTARGFKKGDVLAIYSPNLPEYAIAFHAVSLLGGVVTTMNPLMTAEELGKQLRDSGAKLMLTVPPFLEKAKQAGGQGSIEETFVFGEAKGATPFAELLGVDGDPPGVEIDPRNDLVALPYSSGTTGLPKGVMLTHRNLVANLLQTIQGFTDLSAEDRLIGILPFFHIYGMICVMNCSIYLGCTLVTLPRFELEGFLETLEKHKISFAHLVPPIVLALAKHPLVDKHDLSALRVVVSGAAPLSADLSEACAARLGCAVTQGYGLTETSPVTHLSSTDPAKEVPGSVGPSVSNTECKIIDSETRELLGPGERGEVVIRGPQVMKGYLKNPDATRAMIDDEGWLHTGDIGYADEQGRFFIVDRLKELIKYKGMQVAPAELEGLLLKHPAVADAAVIGSPDQEAGEVPKAFIVRKGEVDADGIMAFVAEHVAPHKKIRRVDFVEQIPKSPSGKILRRLLVEQERARAAN